MRRKAKQILRGEQGLSMILVLCIGAVFVALSAALVYAASVLTANANRQLLEQEAYQLATGFSDMLGEQLNDPDSNFAKFINDSYMKSEFYGNTPYELESLPRSFDANLSADGSDGADAITITLRRRPGDEVELLNLNGTESFISTSTSEWDKIMSSTWGSPSHTIVDLQLDVTVTVENGGESFSYTVTYDRNAHYDVAYYTLDGQGTGATQYQWDGSRTFTPPQGGQAVTIGTDDTSTTIVPHFDTSDPQNITYTRGVRQKSSTAQE